LLTITSMDAKTITTWMNEIAGAVRAERDYLIQLDAAIGDGDHGINMTRGFDAVVRVLAQEEDGTPGKLLTLAGKTLVSSVGGASGPLWGSALRRGGRALGDANIFDAERLVEVLEAALASVVDLGAAAPGDKTMVDALQPAVTTLRREVDAGTALPVAMRHAAEAAEEGMRATIPMQAHKGRASYLGERSVGHQDPGATSTALVVRALERTVAGTQ
jgi:dihydroxyacetone kinase-like protein